MATRSGGRNDERSNQRNAGTGQRSTTGSSSGRSTGASSSAGRGASTGGSSRGGNAGGAIGRNASSSGSGSSAPRSGATTGNRAQQNAGSRASSSASSAELGGSLNQSPSTGASTYSTDFPDVAIGSSPARSSTNPTESGSDTGSSTSADRERELRTSREVGGSSRPSSTAPRSGMGQQRASIPSQIFSGGGNTPFAMMRRMMDDMDRLFSEFGFIHPGQIASGLLGGDIWPSSHASQRGLGAGSSGRPGGSSQQPSAQRGVQRSGQGSGLQSLQGLGLWSPQVEVFERGNNLVVRADLPGLAREDVDVEVDDDALIIRGERRNELDDEHDGYYRSERTYGSFYRAIPLPDNVDPSNCHATFKDGVLEVTMPKPQSTMTKAKRIEVR